MGSRIANANANRESRIAAPLHRLRSPSFDDEYRRVPLVTLIFIFEIARRRCRWTFSLARRSLATRFEPHFATRVSSIMLRELAKRVIPRSQWSAMSVDMMPTTRHVKTLAGWGGVGVFTVFWLIGDDSFAWLKSQVVGASEEEA